MSGHFATTSSSSSVNDVNCKFVFLGSRFEYWTNPTYIFLVYTINIEVGNENNEQYIYIKDDDDDVIKKWTFHSTTMSCRYTSFLYSTVMNNLCMCICLVRGVSFWINCFERNGTNLNGLCAGKVNQSVTSLPFLFSKILPHCILILSMIGWTMVVHILIHIGFRTIVFCCCCCCYIFMSQ